jgi:hypothetical protein
VDRPAGRGPARSINARRAGGSSTAQQAAGNGRRASLKPLAAVRPLPSPSPPSKPSSSTACMLRRAAPHTLRRALCSHSVLEMLHRDTLSVTLPVCVRYIQRDSAATLLTRGGFQRVTDAGPTTATNKKNVITHKLKSQIKFRLHHEIRFNKFFKTRSHIDIFR